jgi:hypothetical protein
MDENPYKSPQQQGERLHPTAVSRDQKESKYREVMWLVVFVLFVLPSVYVFFYMIWGYLSSTGVTG